MFWGFGHGYHDMVATLPAFNVTARVTPCDAFCAGFDPQNRRCLPRLLRRDDSGTPQGTLPAGPPVHRFTSLPVYRSTSPPVHSSTGPPVYRLSGPPVHRQAWPFVHPSTPVSNPAATLKLLCRTLISQSVQPSLDTLTHITFRRSTRLPVYRSTRLPVAGVVEWWSDGVMERSNVLLLRYGC